MTLTIFN